MPSSTTATIAAVTVAVVLLGIPLAFYGARLVRDTELSPLSGRPVEARLTLDRPLTEDMLDPYIGGEDGAPSVSVSVVGPDGSRIRAGEPVEGRAYSEVARTDSGAVVLLSVSYWEVFWRTARAVA